MKNGFLSETLCFNDIYKVEFTGYKLVNFRQSSKELNI